MLGQPSVQERLMTHGIQCGHNNIRRGHFVCLNLNNWHLIRPWHPFAVHANFVVDNRCACGSWQRYGGNTAHKVTQISAYFKFSIASKGPEYGVNECFGYILFQLVGRTREIGMLCIEVEHISEKQVKCCCCFAIR